GLGRVGAAIDGGTEGVCDADSNAQPIQGLVSGQDTCVSVWLDGCAIGAGVVWIVYAIMAFVANDRVEHADLEVQPVHDRRAQGDIGLLDAEVGGSCARSERTAAEGIGIRPEQQVNPVTRGPLSFIERL